MPRTLLLVALSVTLAVAAPAASDPVAALIHAPSFCMGCEVATGTIISGDEAFEVILRRKTVADDLQRVFDHGNVEGQLYALVGLREIDRRRFEEDMARFHGGSVTVVLTRDPPSVLRSDGPV